MTTHTPVRSVAIAAALGIALSTSAIGAPLAFAQTTSPTSSSTPKPVSNIDFSAKGSITVHKRDLGDSTPEEPTGNVDATPPGTALAGAGFSLFAVTNADLTTNAGFNAAAQLTPATAVIGTTATATGTTDASGQIVFGNLPVGVYVLRETVAPEGFSPSADSLVFIPMTNPDDTSAWNYNVHVYPKNSKNEVVKEVNDADQNVGDDIVYTITADIPQVVVREGESTAITKYEVHDDLDETRLGTPAVTVGLSDGTTFVEGTDYSLVIDSATLEVSVVFTDPVGLAKLTAAKADDSTAKVVVTLTSEVLAMGGTSVITNDATTITNNGGGGGDTETTSNPVESYYGKLKVVKFDGDTDEYLTGATFQLYLCSDQDTLIGNPLTVGGEDSWTTGGTDGSFLINALHVTDFENGAEIEPDSSYCLVETEAPDGYELLPNPVEISFTRADLETTTEGDDAVTLVSKVENVKSVTPQLPLTGGAGIGILAGLGALIVGAGAWTARRLSRS